MTGDWFVGQLAQALGAPVPGIVAVLYAYLDESGISGTPKATLVGGVIGSLETFAEVEPRWSGRVHADGVSMFHASKCRGGHGEYHPWRPDWGRMRKHYADLAAIAGAYDLRPVSGAVIHADWQALDDPAIKQRFPSAYAFCFELCLFHIQRVARELQDEALVVYAINDQYAERAGEVARAYAANRQSFDRLRSVAPASQCGQPGLQIADMVAYEMYHLWHSAEATKRPEIELMPRLEAADQPNGFYYDADALKVLSATGSLGMI